MALSVKIEKKVEDFYLNVDFEAENDVLAILGPSGCGKSMTLKCIAGIETPDSGKIVLDGVTLFDSEKKINLPPQKRNVGYLFQQYALFPNMTVEQNILCGVRDKKCSAVEDMIQMMNLGGLEKKKPHELSGGQQQRVALARILVNEPEVLLLDEPFSALDSFLKAQLIEEVHEIIRKFGKTVLLVSHDREEVNRLSDRMVMMKNGKIETRVCSQEPLSYPESVLAAREKVFHAVVPIETEKVAIAKCAGRILGQDVEARENVPPFDRSPYDGYAFRGADTIGATKEHPVTLQILEEVAAGSVSKIPMTEGCAVKILTGAPIPEGADAVIKFEQTTFTNENVTIFETVKAGSNIVRKGEDVKVGETLAEKGWVIDPALMGTLAAQNIEKPEVYRVPKVGIISTGSELLQVGEESQPGKIYNSNEYVFAALLEKIGCTPVIYGNATDDVNAICEKILKGLSECDALILTGGVSVGDYDLTPAAMEMAGVEMLFQGVDIKPGMACAYGTKDGKLVCGLSGNPASAMTNFYVLAYPAFRRLCGYSSYLPQEITVKLLDTFHKKSKKTRILRGTLELSDGTVGMRLPKGQGNTILSSAIGCNVMAIVPAGSGPLPINTKLKGFLI